MKSVGGCLIPFQKTADGKMLIGSNGAHAFFPNRPGSNGVNHIIDKVISVDNTC